MNIKTGYKQTEIGVIPENWKVKKLSDVSQLITKGTTPKKFSENGINFIKIECFDGNLINQEKFAFVDAMTHSTELKRSILHEGDILFAIAGATIGKCNVVQSDVLPANTNQALAIVRLKQNENREYVYRFLASYKMQKYIIDNVSVGAQPNLNLEQIGNFSFSYPPLQEQTAIAAALSDVDALMGELDKLIAKKRDIKQATMQQLLTGKKRLAGFSGEWEVKTFGELFDYLPTATNSRADLSESGDAYYIHYGDIHTRFHNHLNFKKTQPSKIERCKCKNAAFLQNGDWVMADASEDFDGVGKSIEILGLNENTKAVAGLHTFLLREKRPSFAPMFKGHLGNLKSLHEQFLRVATGMKVFGVSKTALKDLVLTIPSIEEQTAIATILSDMDAEISQLEDRLVKTVQLKQGMMQELLTGRIRLC